MKYVTLVLLVIFAQPLLPLPRQAVNEQAEHTHKKPAEANKGKQATDPADSAGVGVGGETNTYNTYKFASDTHPEPAKQSDPWTKGYTLTAIYDVLTALLVIVAAGTGWVIWRQTIATRKAAEAALLNAQALINSERPWIDVLPVSQGDGEWRFEASNYGRTPAELVSTSCRFEIISDLMNGLTEPPLYKDRKESYKRFIFLNNPARVGLMNIKSLLDACAEKAEVLSGAKAFIIIGRVVYYDVLNRVDPPHETRYCYGWSIRDDTLFWVGPSGYHGHT